MQFYVPIPWPLALILGVFIGLARVIKWVAVRVFWPALLYAAGFFYGYTKTKFTILRGRMAERREWRRRAAQAVADFERVEKEAEQYFSCRVIEGEARRIEEGEQK